jgi:hypothetical protein
VLLLFGCSLPAGANARRLPGGRRRPANRRAARHRRYRIDSRIDPNCVCSCFAPDRWRASDTIM